MTDWAVAGFRRPGLYFLGLIACLVALWVPVSAGAVMLSSEDTLVVEFQIIPPFTCSDNACDADSIRLNLGPIEVYSAYTEWGSQLYDGGTLLGEYGYNGYGQHEGHLVGLAPARFHDQEIEYNKSTGVDFTTFDDGSIQGRIELGIYSGLLELELQNIDITLKSLEGELSGASIVAATIIRGGAQATPEPTAAVVFGVGLAVFAAARRRRNA